MGLREEGSGAWLKFDPANKSFFNTQGKILTPQGGLEFTIKYYLNWGWGS